MPERPAGPLLQKRHEQENRAAKLPVAFPIICFIFATLCDEALGNHFYFVAARD
jgi:hypothetical protein